MQTSFGASTSSAFGASSAPFGAKPATGGFGAQPTNIAPAFGQTASSGEKPYTPSFFRNSFEMIVPFLCRGIRFYHVS
jgi:hypothetical protein